MVLTVTLNPSLDISYPIEHLKINDVNRCQNVSKTAGGKGLNVTRVLHQMSHPVCATGFLGGNIGRYIAEQLSATGIQHDFQPIDGETRNCIAILHDDGEQTEILEGGPILAEKDLVAFETHLVNLLEKHEIVTISGSLSKGLPQTSYQLLIAELNKQDKKVVLDSSGASLKAALVSNDKPYAIKPNLTEIEDLTGKKLSLDHLEEIKALLETELFQGIELIVISLGSKGAFAKVGPDYYRVSIPKIEVVNPVGSGDSTVAGLAMALEQGKPIEDVLKTAMTLGLLNTMEAKTGQVDPTKFQTYFELVEVKKV